MYRLPIFTRRYAKVLFGGPELNKMCSQRVYSVIVEIRSFLPQWSLPKKFEYGITLMTRYYLPGDREEKEGSKL